MGWIASAFESLLGVGSVDSMTPTAVLRRLPLRDEYTDAETRELYELAEEDPAQLARMLEADGHPKWAAAVRSAYEAEAAREGRHVENIRQTGRDIGRDVGKVGRTGASWLPIVGILAAVVLVTQSGKR